MKFLPQAAVFLSAAFLGGSFVATRVMMAEATPGTLAFLRYGTAFVCLLPFIRIGQYRQWRRRDLTTVFIIGLLQFGVFHYLINSALAIIPASRGAVIFALIPILTMAIAAVFRTERLQAGKLFAGGLAVLGVAIALSEKAFASDGASATWVGEGLFVAAVLCGATYNSLSGKLLISYGTMPVTILAMGCGVLFTAVTAVEEGLLQAWPDYSAKGWMLVFYLAIPAGAVAFYLFNWGLRRLSPAGAAIFVPVAPMTATLLGALLLGEEISPLFVVGLFCVLLGIYLINRSMSRYESS